MQVFTKENLQHTYFLMGVQELDICSERAVYAYVSKHKIDVTVNCVAYTAMDKAEDDAGLCDKLNNAASGYLARVAQANGTAMIQVSAGYVPDGTAHILCTEDRPTCPTSVYGSTKLTGEQNVMNHCEKAMVIRMVQLYSIYGSNFVKTMIRLEHERESSGAISNQIGTPTYVNGLALTIFAALNKGIVRGICHFSDEGVCSWYNFTTAIYRLARITSCKVKPLHATDYPAKVPRPHYSALDKTKVKETSGTKTPHWEESPKRCINQLRVENL